MVSLIFLANFTICFFRSRCIFSDALDFSPFSLFFLSSPPPTMGRLFEVFLDLPDPKSSSKCSPTLPPLTVIPLSSVPPPKDLLTQSNLKSIMAFAFAPTPAGPSPRTASNQPSDAQGPDLTTHELSRTSHIANQYHSFTLTLQSGSRVKGFCKKYMPNFKISSISSSATTVTLSRSDVGRRSLRCLVLVRVSDIATTGTEFEYIKDVLKTVEGLQLHAHQSSPTYSSSLVERYLDASMRSFQGMQQRERTSEPPDQPLLLPLLRIFSPPHTSSLALLLSAILSERRVIITHSNLPTLTLIIESLLSWISLSGARWQVSERVSERVSEPFARFRLEVNAPGFSYPNLPFLCVFWFLHFSSLLCNQSSVNKNTAHVDHCFDS